MRSPANELKRICITTAVMLLIEMLLLLGLALAVFYGAVDLVAAETLLTVALILSTAIGVNVVGGINVSNVTGYFAAGLFVFAALLLLLIMGSTVTLSGTVKSVLAAVIGVFIGNFIKKFGHNKLGKNKKRRKVSTK